MLINVSRNTTLKQLRSALMNHFDFQNYVSYNLDTYNIAGRIPQANWILVVNNEDYDDYNIERNIGELGVKNNDLIQLRIHWNTTELVKLPHSLDSAICLGCGPSMGDEIYMSKFSEMFDSNLMESIDL